MNKRQFALYNYLKEQGDKWTFQEEIARNLVEWYYFKSGENFHNSNARLLMTKDIRAINDDPVIQKIIISSPRGIKLANETEFNAYIKGQYKSVFSKLKRIRQKERKASLDGQTRLVFKSERDCIEAFLKEN